MGIQKLSIDFFWVIYNLDRNNFLKLKYNINLIIFLLFF